MHMHDRLSHCYLDVSNKSVVLQNRRGSRCGNGRLCGDTHFNSCPLQNGSDATGHNVVGERWRGSWRSEGQLISFILEGEGEGEGEREREGGREGESKGGSKEGESERVREGGREGES